MSDANKNSLLALFQRYWQAYGGCKTFIRSPYTIFALIFAAALYPLWSNNALTDIALSVLPSLLGFTLGGYAMFLAFGDRDFLKILTQATAEGHSIYRAINSTFVHFILVQILGLLWALLSKAYFPTPEKGESFSIIQKALIFPGAFLFVYALVLALAVTLNLFRFTTWYETALSRPTKDGQGCRYSAGQG